MSTLFNLSARVLRMNLNKCEDWPAIVTFDESGFRPAKDPTNDLRDVALWLTVHI